MFHNRSQPFTIIRRFGNLTATEHGGECWHRCPWFASVPSSKVVPAGNDDGTNLRALTDPLDLRGAPAWAPTGKTIVVASYDNGAPRLFSVSVDGGPLVPLVSDYAMDPVWSPDGRVLVYSGPDIGTTFSIAAVTSVGIPSSIPNLTLTRGARRLVFVRGGHALIVLRGEIEHKDFWFVDLETGTERRLTSFDRDVIVRDFDVSPDDREIVFDRIQENSDIVLIEPHDVPNPN